MSNKSIYGKVVSTFEKLWKETPKFEHAASAALTVIAPIVETALYIMGDAPLAVELENIVARIKVDFTAAATIVETSGPTPNLTSVLNSIVANLNLLMVAAEIKDPATQQKVREVAVVIVAEIEAVIAAYPHPTSTTSTVTL